MARVKPGKIKGKGRVLPIDERVPVTLLIGKQEHEGWALAWNGELVHVRYIGTDGNQYMTWADASAVTRR